MAAADPTRHVRSKDVAAFIAPITRPAIIIAPRSRRPARLRRQAPPAQISVSDEKSRVQREFASRNPLRPALTKAPAQRRGHKET